VLAYLAGVKEGRVYLWQVTLCDPLRQVSCSCSSLWCGFTHTELCCFNL